MSDFVNGEAVEISLEPHYWQAGVFVGADGAFFICRTLDTYRRYHALHPSNVRRPYPSLEERLAELAYAASGVLTHCRMDGTCPNHRDCDICRASFTNALMLAAIEEARDEDR